jgi:heme a synthase
MHDIPVHDQSLNSRATQTLALLTVCFAGMLLILGWLVTSFRAGMADPVWPTEPWYLMVNGQVLKEEKAGFLLEHTHRLAGFIVGALVSLTTLFIWRKVQTIWLRVLGYIVIVILLVTYGSFHREMGKVWSARQLGESTKLFPLNTGIITFLIAMSLVLLSFLAMRRRETDRWLVVSGSIALICVMAQGLLGGYRVFLDQLIGTELAVIHGMFGQLVFCILVVTYLLTLPKRSRARTSNVVDKRLLFPAYSLVIVLMMQLFWGVIVRQYGSPFAQRLHFIFAFIITATIIWHSFLVLMQWMGDRESKLYAVILLVLLGLQIVLGIEAWMSKFAFTGSSSTLPPELRPLSIASATIRTLHAMVGAALLTTSVINLVQLSKRCATRANDTLPTNVHDQIMAPGKLATV